MVFLTKVIRTGRRKWYLSWCLLVTVIIAMVVEVTALNGPNVCMVKQKYNITKRVKYRAPMSVRTYEWCFAMPPRCSKWNTEIRDLTRLETEERTAEVAVCCPGYKMKDVSCVAICPNGRTGSGCSDACPTNKWGPNCVNKCGTCEHGSCSPITGECRCRDGWQGESCEISLPPITIPTLKLEVLTTNPTTKTSTIPTTTPAETSKTTTLETKTTSRKETISVTPKTTPTTMFTTTAKLLNTVNTEKATELDIFIPLNQTSLVTTQRIIDQTTIAPIPDITKNLKTSIYNRTEIPLLTAKIDVATIKSKIDATAAVHINKPTSELPINVKTTEKVNEPELMRSLSILNSEQSKNIRFTSTSINNLLDKESVRLTTALPKTVTTESYTMSTTVKDITPSITFTIKEVIKTEPIRNLDTTVKIPTTIKLQPKEIWIKPALKVEINEPKKAVNDVTKNRISTNKEFSSNTTPKTIIVSIIPTSVSYATFKKIALTTAAYFPQKNNTTKALKATGAFTIPFTSTTTTLSLQTSTRLNITKSSTAKKTETTKSINTTLISEPDKTNKTKFTNTKNTGEAVTHFNITTKASIESKLITKRTTLINKTPNTTPMVITEHPHRLYITAKHRNLTKSTTHKVRDDKMSPTRENDSKTLTNANKITTENPLDEEVFHILTEPEHITAVMGDKERARTSMNLVSVVGIAGGIMMAVITVAVVIVMIERCKRPRYENVGKINDIHMQVMIENNDAPPPYVRSIFHTPLPEPPLSDKSHYQPISTLDRNLKQFMRPVVVQAISPIMLENFRGILECHYDHLPRRSHNFQPIDNCCATAPSMSRGSELHCIRRSIVESNIEALKCEAKMDVIDTTTSEPLYAEIPCWRPPSEHATEVINLNGEAVTEL